MLAISTCESGDVLRTVLALYIVDYDHPLPTHEEVLVCNPKTTAEEVHTYLL